MSALCRLPFFQVIAVAGEDAAEFLHGQLSNHITDLAVGEACFATYNTPKGRVLANMLVWRLENRFLLLMAADLAAAVVKRLRMFVLRSKVVFDEAAGWQVYGQSGMSGPQPAADALKLPFAEAEGVLSGVLAGGNGLLLSRESLPAADTAAAESTWFAGEIRAGRPWISAATSEAAVAQMLNQHRLGGVHFKKGCYPGQEIIARAQYRGQVKRGLAQTRSESAVAPGNKIDVAGEEAGIVINNAADGNGFIQLSVIKFAAAGQSLSCEGQALRLEKTWFEAEDEAS